MKNILILLTILSSSSMASATSAFTEKNYQHIRQEGRVHVECNDGMNQGYNSFWCEGSYLDPAGAEHFKTQKRDGLHHVALTVQNAEGTFKTTRRLNSWNGKTWLKIPLWGSSGILAVGQNSIDYSVENSDDQPLEQGQFLVKVTEPAVRECRPMWVHSTNMFDCQMASYACQQLSWPRSECQR